jgi:hypothetical protein
MEFLAVIFNRKIAAFDIYLWLHGADEALCCHLQPKKAAGIHDNLPL